MTLTDVLIILVVSLCVLVVCLGIDNLDQRSQRRDAEDDLKLARGREARLHEQTPFAKGTRLPE